MLGQTLQERYRLDEILGQGGMGIVYRAYDTVLQRPIAIKLLSHSQLGSEGRERMLLEAQAVARLNHPNIVSVYDVGRSDKTPFIVMELVEGQLLRQLKLNSLAQALEIGQSICLALQHAHENGIIHRDLKPENIFFSNSHIIKLMDFGLAQVRGGPNITDEGTLIGTFNYMAPELLNGGKATVQSDLYALGIILYELAAGRPPFDGENLVAILSQHLNAPVTPPSNYNDVITPMCDHLILQLLRKEPQLRPRSAEHVYEALTAIIARPSEEPSHPSAEFSLLDRIVRGRLVARQSELKQLHNLWQHSRQGNANIALLSGEPGAGKTRLAEEFLVEARLRGITILRGGCYEYEAITPYLPLVEALREWVHNQETADLTTLLGNTAPELARLVPEIESKLGPQPPSTPLSPEETRSRLFDNIARFFRTLAKENGLILFIDDLHWADGGTLNLLHYLMRRLRRERLFILANYREVELDRTHPLSAALVTWNRERLATRITLNRFSETETADMLAALFGQDVVENDFAAAIFKETEGNPFFIEEVVKALIDQEQIYRKDGEWFSHDIEALTIPQSVKEAIGRRLNKLSQDCIDVLHLAAVLGKQFEFANLEFATQKDEEYALSALDEAMNAQLIRLLSGETFAFTHDKIREVLYSEINPIRRRRLHQRVGETLEQRNSADLTKVVQELAFHFVEAANPEKGMQYSILAAKRAFDLSSLEESITYYEQARQCAIGLENNQRQLEINLQLAQIFTLRGEFDKARDAYRQAVKLTTDPRQEAAIRVKKIGVDVYSGQLADADMVLASIEKLDQETQTHELSEALTFLGRHHHYKAEFDKAISYLNRAYQLAQSINDPFTMSNIFGYLAGAHQHQSKLRECLNWGRKSIAFGEAHQYLPAVAIGYEFLSETYNLMGRWADGYSYGRQDEIIGEKLGSQVRIAWATMSQGWAYLGLGRYDEAIALSHEAIELGEATDQGRMITLVRYVLTAIYLNRGQFDLAKKEANEIITLADSIQQSWISLLAFHMNALKLALRGDWNGALNLFEAIEYGTFKDLTKTAHLFTISLHAELLFLTNRYEQAIVLLEKVIEIAKTAESQSVQGICHRILGQVFGAQGNSEAALNQFNQAVGIQRQLEGLPELARALHYRGQLFQATNQPDTAELDLKEAQALVQEIGLILSPLTSVNP